MSFELVEKRIRIFEADQKVYPCVMYKDMRDDEEIWHIEFDKLVLYANKDDQTRQHWFKAKDKLKYAQHAAELTSVLERTFPGVVAAVEVLPKFKMIPFLFLQLPFKIPFTDIGWHKEPNQVLGNNKLATMPTRIKISLSKMQEDIDPEKLWKMLNKIACTHSDNDGGGGNVSDRPTHNPFRWIGYGLSHLVPREVALMMPNFLRSLGRVYPYGYPIAGSCIDNPVFDSGLAAQVVNAGIVVSSGAAIIAALASSFKENNSSTPYMVAFALGAILGENNARMLGTAGVLAPRGGLINGLGYGLLFSYSVEMLKTMHRTEDLPFATQALIQPKGY